MLGNRTIFRTDSFCTIRFHNQYPGQIYILDSNFKILPFFFHFLNMLLFMELLYCENHSRNCCRPSRHTMCKFPFVTFFIASLCFFKRDISLKVDYFFSFFIGRNPDCHKRNNIYICKAFS
jgi:hypothetical protein